MAINLVESVQQKLNIQELQKIDPDTGKVFDTDKLSDKFYQLAIPAVLTGLYDFTRVDETNRNILNVASGNLLSLIFGNKKDAVISKISEFTATSVNETNDKLQNIGSASITTIKENLSENPLDKEVKDFLTGQRHNILSYLDPALQIGDIFKDSTIDDSTNKMEGPVSGLMHNIGQIFSGSGNNEKEEI